MMFCNIQFLKKKTIIKGWVLSDVSNNVGVNKMKHKEKFYNLLIFVLYIIISFVLTLFLDFKAVLGCCDLHIL